MPEYMLPLLILDVFTRLTLNFLLDLSHRVFVL